MTVWGVWDSVDKSWFGDYKGPKLFSRELLATDDRLKHLDEQDVQILARTAALMAAVQLGRSPLEIVAKVYDIPSVRYKGDVGPVLMTSLEALTILEGGSDGEEDSERA